MTQQSQLEHQSSPYLYLTSFPGFVFFVCLFVFWCPFFNQHKLEKIEDDYGFSNLYQTFLFLKITCLYEIMC